ncbi:unnamed protein product [Trifolium pratense]|uniref:Uncharacterized protein n=1 Tax=Trifolium pratense TaxID=57577 RepID=A0ACB0JK27_TRIPR|nr:unnamed protein product [Trifolium pratense]
MAAAKDIISTLPDEILCHILSFLQTKQSVATSILSKRWNPLWLSVTTLYFQTEIADKESTLLFNDFVYSFLVSRNATLPIETFHLQISYDSPLECPNSIAKWVKFVLQNGVKYFYFCISLGNGLPIFPARIFSCKTLVFLKLMDFYMEEGYSSVQLPSLKTLHLDTIAFSKLQHFMVFLSSCPILESLLTRYVWFNSEESSTCNEWKSFCLANLITADIDFTECYFPLKVVHNVRSLTFGIHEVFYNDLIPTFHNLTQLKLLCKDCITWQFLLEVLNHCPKLQKLDLDQGKVDDETWIRNFDKENWVDPYVVPQCFTLHLRTCNLLQFHGQPGEVILARYILKNAKVLQNMTIWNSSKSELHCLAIKRMLSAYPWASSMCKLIVSPNKSSEDKEEVAELSVARVDPLLRLLDFVNLLDQ